MGAEKYDKPHIINNKKNSGPSKCIATYTLSRYSFVVNKKYQTLQDVTVYSAL